MDEEFGIEFFWCGEVVKVDCVNCLVDKLNTLLSLFFSFSKQPKMDPYF